MQRLEEASTSALPSDLREWLAHVNGARGGPGGLYGSRPDDPTIDIVAILRQFPIWNERGWIPIAGDGCGNHYVIFPVGPHRPVGFVDITDRGSEEIAYVAASSCPIFLEQLLRKEVERSRWPFDREMTLARDPEIEAAAGRAPLPWNAG
jgi:hypothetical protein